MMEGPGANSEEKHEPVSDIDTAVVVVGLKALDPEWPIREAIDPLRKSAACFLPFYFVISFLRRGACPMDAKVKTAPEVGPQARLYFTIVGFGDCRGVPIASGVFCELPLSLSLFLPGTGKA